MSLYHLDKQKLKAILKTSQGFGAQVRTSQAMVKGGNGSRILSPSRTGHAVSNHVRGNSTAAQKSKFCSLDDMAGALEALLKTSVGRAAIASLSAGKRECVEAEIEPMFPLEVEMPGFGRVNLNTVDLIALGIRRLRCVAILEGRERGGDIYLHVHTFYPKLSATQEIAMVNSRRSR